MQILILRFICEKIIGKLFSTDFSRIGCDYLPKKKQGELGVGESVLFKGSEVIDPSPKYQQLEIRNKLWYIGEFGVKMLRIVLRREK